MLLLKNLKQSVWEIEMEMGKQRPFCVASLQDLFPHFQLAGQLTLIVLFQLLSSFLGVFVSNAEF